MEEKYPKTPAVAGELMLLFLLATLWGGSYTFIKLGVATIPPITLIAGRTAIAGLLLMFILRWRGLRLPADGATWRRFAFQACLNSVVPWTLIAWAERSVDAGLATILNSTSPIFTFFLALAVAHQEAAGPRKLFGVAIGMAGICLIVGVQAFAAISDGRSKYFPDVPTMAEQGYAEAQVTPWFGIVVPTGTPQPIVNRISGALEIAIANPEVREKLDLAGCAAKSAPLGEFTDIIKSDIALWAKVVKDAGIPAD